MLLFVREPKTLWLFYSQQSKRLFCFTTVLESTSAGTGCFCPVLTTTFRVPVGDRPPGAPGSQDATADERLLDEWFNRWPGQPIALGLEQSGILVASVSRDPDEATTELAERILELRTPQIRYESEPAGRTHHHVLLRAPFEFDYADLGLDRLTDLWTEGSLTLPCECGHLGYRWAVDVEEVGAFPDWLQAAVDELSSATRFRRH